jgi:hypothetical protein
MGYVYRNWTLLLTIASLWIATQALAFTQDELLVYRFDGDVAGAQQGFTVAAAGDVNGDGRGDVIVGRVLVEPFDPANGGNFLKALVYSGADGSLLFTMGEPVTPLGASYNAVDGLGDIDGDGLGEVVVGTPGAVVVVLIRGDPFPIITLERRGIARIHAGSSTSIIDVVGDVEGELFGAAVAGVGDLNGDTVPDFVVGAPRADPDLQTGRIAAFSGATGELLWELRGFKDAQFGIAADGLGDVNQDQHPDVVVGARFALGGGLVVVINGFTGKELYRVFPPGPSELFGSSVAGVGDVDGDGKPDFIVGAPGAGGVPGKAYVYAGETGTLLFALTDGSPGDLFGLAVAGAGDIDADGRPDMLVGAPQARREGVPVGSVFVFSGATAALLLRLHGEQAGDLFGNAVDSVGDVTGDGVPEFVVGAPGTSQSLPLFATGSAYVFSSQPVPRPDIAVSPSPVAFGEVPADTRHSRTVTLENLGDADLQVVEVALEEGSSRDFGLIPPAVPLQIPPGGRVAFEVTYQPAALGLAGGRLSIRSNDFDEARLVVPLSGLGLAPEIDVVPLQIDFGSVQVRRSTTTSIRILNLGTDTLVVSAISLDPASSSNFTISAAPATPATLEPGQSVNVLVSYCPLSSGALEQGAMVIVSNDADESTIEVALSGTGR